MDQNLWLEQMELEVGEMGAIKEGERDYKQAVQKSFEKNKGQLPPHLWMLESVFPNVVNAVTEFLDTGYARRHGSIKTAISELSAYELAYVTLSVMIRETNIRTGASLRSLSEEIAKSISDQVTYARFQEANPQLAKSLTKRIQSSTKNKAHASRVIKGVNSKLNICEAPAWTPEERLTIGEKMIELVIATTGMFRIEMRRIRGPKTDNYVVGHESVIEKLKEAHEKCSQLHPLYMPCIVPPKPWDGLRGGGFYSGVGRMNLNLIKTRHKDSRERTKKAKLPEQVLEAVNTLQNTPWRVNTAILEVTKAVMGTASGFGIVPKTEAVDFPAKPWGEDEQAGEKFKAEHPKEFGKWKFLMREAYKAVEEKKADVKIFFRAVSRAERFSVYEKIYFVYETDWRGRVYPVQLYLHPQGNDFCRGVLQFAEGMPLGEDGASWLAVHGANTYGYDKDSFEGRVQWVEEHEQQILDSASNPMDCLWWTNADGGTKPFQFLAFCMEWKAYRESGLGKDFVSRLPIGMDGSCNGLQHFAALLRDKKGGEKVNLLGTDKPADVYATVAAEVSRLVDLDTDDSFKPAIYLVKKMEQAIGSVIKAAPLAMTWAKEVASLCTKADLPMTWVTPSGFPVVQNYFKKKEKLIAVYWGKQRVRLSILVDTDKRDGNRARGGASPNIIHSLDATHLVFTVNQSRKEGITSFAMIHDSYGTHAGNVTKLNRILREQFVRLYSKDVLGDLAEQIKAQLPEELAEKMPVLPEYGDLDINSVLAACRRERPSCEVGFPNLTRMNTDQSLLRC